MEKRKTLREDPLGTILLSEEDKPIGIYTRCPHCGMTDMRYSIQGAKETHWHNSRVGGVHTVECGKCRKIFKTLELTVPADMTPMELYEMIRQKEGLE